MSRFNSFFVNVSIYIGGKSQNLLEPEGGQLSTDKTGHQRKRKKSKACQTAFHNKLKNNACQTDVALKPTSVAEKELKWPEAINPVDIRCPSLRDVACQVSATNLSEKDALHARTSLAEQEKKLCHDAACQASILRPWQDFNENKIFETFPMTVEEKELINSVYQKLVETKGVSCQTEMTYVKHDVSCQVAIVHQRRNISCQVFIPTEMKDASCQSSNSFDLKDASCQACSQQTDRSCHAQIFPEREDAMCQVDLYILPQNTQVGIFSKNIDTKNDMVDNTKSIACQTFLENHHVGCQTFIMSHSSGVQTQGKVQMLSTSHSEQSFNSDSNEPLSKIEVPKKRKEKAESNISLPSISNGHTLPRFVHDKTLQSYNEIPIIDESKWKVYVGQTTR